MIQAETCNTDGSVLENGRTYIWNGIVCYIRGCCTTVEKLNKNLQNVLNGIKIQRVSTRRPLGPCCNVCSCNMCLNNRHRAFERHAGLTLRWRHHGRDSVSNHQPYDCFLNRFFRRRCKKTSKLRITGLCAGISPGTGEFPTQMASNAENVSIWWRHHE